MYRAVKQRRVEHFASRSKWLSAGYVLQEFRHGDLFRADLRAGYWNARWRNHDAMARLIVIQRNHSNVTANDAHEYFKRAYFLPFIDSVLYGSTRRAFHSSKSCCLPAINAFLPAFLNSSKYDDIGPAAAKPYRQFLPDGGLVALKMQHLRWQQTAILRGTKDILWRDLTVPETLRVAAKLQWDISRYPAVSVLLRFLRH